MCNTNSMININLTSTATVNSSTASAVKWLWEAQMVYCTANVNLSCKIAMTLWQHDSVLCSLVGKLPQLTVDWKFVKLSQWRVNLTFHCNSVYKLACLFRWRWHLAGKWHTPPASFRATQPFRCHCHFFFSPTQILNMNIYKLSL